MMFKNLVGSVFGSKKERQEITEVAPGIFEERRFFLWTSLGALGSLMMSSATSFGQSTSSSGETQTASTNNTNAPGSSDVDFKNFARQCSALAKQAAEDANLNQDAHVFRLSSLASALRIKDVPKGKLGPYGKWDPPVELGPIHLAVPLTIIQWRMAPHAVFPPHNHSPADVISLCLEGEARVRHFDVVGDAPEYSSPKSFFIRETRNDLLTPGRMSSLTTLRDNIHQFKAGKDGALGIDINTILPGDKPFSFLRYEDKPKDADRNIYEAAWISGV